MRTIGVVICLMVPTAGLAWDRLNGAGITEALSDQSVRYDAHTLQHFHASGVTEYLTERYSEGRWAARGDQYCSTWPPSDLWTCYDVDVLDNRIRFVAADGTIAEGAFVE